MIIQFNLSTGQTVTTDPITQEMLDEIGEDRAEDTVAQMLHMFKDFKNLTNVRVDGVCYNPAHIVSVEHFDHEWLKERWPDLDWWDNE